MPLAGLRHWLVRKHLDVNDQADGDVGSTGSGHLPSAQHARAAVPAGAQNVPQNWTAARIDIEEELWGTGYLTPGGAPELLRVVAPLGLTAASRLLLLGAGAGGPALTLAIDRGVWVVGHEADTDLAALAARRLQRAGDALAKRATVQPWDRHAAVFAKQSCNHALAIDAIRDAAPEPLLDAVIQALKPRGKMIVLETVSAEPLHRPDPDITAWCALEGRVATLPTADTITRAFTRLGCEVRAPQDISARHMRLAMLGWKHLQYQVAQQRPNPQRTAALAAAVELWTRRIRLMEAGSIRLLCCHVLVPGRPSNGLA